jgi:hypothetical protein
MSASKDFNKARALFMKRASGPEFPASVLKLAYLIAFTHMDSETETARVGQLRLAADLKVTTRAVQKLTLILRRFGLQVKTGKGPEQANVYRIGPPPEEEENANYSSHIKTENANYSSPIREENANWRDTNMRTGETENANYSSPLLNKSLQEESPSKKDSHTSFEEWWTHYPRKVAKGQARKAYSQVVRKGTATEVELLAGAMRYAGERIDQDERFTKHPATWLHGECWKDEPAASPARRSSFLDSIERGLAMVDDDASEVSQ